MGNYCYNCSYYLQRRHQSEAVCGRGLNFIDNCPQYRDFSRVLLRRYERKYLVRLGHPCPRLLNGFPGLTVFNTELYQSSARGRHTTHIYGYVIYEDHRSSISPPLDRQIKERLPKRARLLDLTLTTVDVEGRSFLRLYIDLHLKKHNPRQGRPKPQPKNNTLTYITIDSVRELFNLCESKGYRVWSGLRMHIKELGWVVYEKDGVLIGERDIFEYPRLIRYEIPEPIYT